MFNKVRMSEYHSNETLPQVKNEVNIDFEYYDRDSFSLEA